MSPIILYLLQVIQYQNYQIRWLLKFICKFIPLKQWVHDDSNPPGHQKFKTDILPIIVPFVKKDWRKLLKEYQDIHGKQLRPVQRRNGKSIPEHIVCPACDATHHYLYDNNGDNGQYLCKICSQSFTSGKHIRNPLKLKCPYCTHSLSPIKSRKFFIVHKCINNKCSYYQDNLKKVSPGFLDKNEKFKFKLHYIYREFTVDFFCMDLNSLPKNASSLKFRKESAYIMSLCLTFHVNLGLSLRKTSQALKELYNISVSHTMVANYARTAACLVKPFVDTYDYPETDTHVADETYIKVRGVKSYVWFIMDAISRSIIGYQVSDNRSVGPCILAMRMAFRGLKKLPSCFRFIADGYSAYPLAAQQFALREDNPLKFDITQVIGLTDDDEVSKEFRPFKQMVERLNRTFKASYRVRCGYDNLEGANYNVSLWVAYYNFLRPHKHNHYKVLNKVDALQGINNMPGKWQVLILLGQQTVLQWQENQSRAKNCSSPEPEVVSSHRNL